MTKVSVVEINGLFSVRVNGEEVASASTLRAAWGKALEVKRELHQNGSEYVPFDVNGIRQAVCV